MLDYHSQHPPLTKTNENIKHGDYFMTLSQVQNIPSVSSISAAASESMRTTEECHHGELNTKGYKKRETARLYSMTKRQAEPQQASASSACLTPTNKIAAR